MITRQSENDLSKYKEVSQTSLNILDTTNQEDFRGVTVTQENDLNKSTDKLKPLIRKRKIYENFVVLYLDSDLKYAEDISNTTEISPTDANFKKFYNANECIDYITNINDKKVYFIISALFGEWIIPLIYLLPQIISIYIFNSDSKNNERHEEWSQPYKMIVRGVYNHMNLICEQLGEDIFNSTSNAGMKLLNNTKNLSSNNIITKSNEFDIHYEQEPSFMYGQLLKEFLLQMSYSTESKQQMFDFCSLENRDNESQLQMIKQFEETYSKNKVLWWYTKDSFLYRILNKVLREQDVEGLYNLRLVLRDLHDQISGLHLRFLGCSLNIDIFKVYRGLGMFNDDFQNLQNKIGGFLSINTFLSTSKDINVALGFVIPLVDLTDRTAVLFEIEIDFYNCRTPFADIQDHSQIKEEQEVLFTMGTIFRIKNIQFIEESAYWKVFLQLTDDEDEDVGYLTKYLRKEIMSTSLNPLENFASLMINMGKFSLAEKMYLELLQDSSIDSDSLTNINNSLGIIYVKTDQLEKAIEYYIKALETSTESRIACIYNNLGGVYRDQEDYEKALSYYNLALKIDLNSAVPFKYNLAIRYNNIANIYSRQQRYEEALELYNKALQIRLDRHPVNHPSIATSYNDISIVYHSLHDYDKSIEYLKKALAIQLNSLPSNHLDFAVVYRNLAMSFYNQTKLEEALEYMEKSHEIHSKNLPSDHPRIITDLNWMLNITEKLCEQEIKLCEEEEEELRQLKDG